MIKLIDLLVETKQDSIARKITGDIVKSLVEQLKVKTRKYHSFEQERDIDLEKSNTTLKYYIVKETPKGFERQDGLRVTDHLKVQGGVTRAGDVSIIVIVRTDTTLQDLDINKAYYRILTLVRHELEHLYQQDDPENRHSALYKGGREKASGIEEPSFQNNWKPRTQMDYRSQPTEMEADAKAINLLKKKKRISFEEAAKLYYQGFNLFSDIEIDTLVSNISEYAKKFNF